MDVVYTRHAEEKIAERKLSKTIIENALKNPDTVLESISEKRIAHKLIRNKLLRIVYTRKSEKYVIITAYFTEPERYEVIL